MSSTAGTHTLTEKIDALQNVIAKQERHISRIQSRHGPWDYERYELMVLHEILDEYQGKRAGDTT